MARPVFGDVEIVVAIDGKSVRADFPAPPVVGPVEVVEPEEDTASGEAAIVGDIEGEDVSRQVFGNEKGATVGREGDAIGIVDSLGDTPEAAITVEIEHRTLRRRRSARSCRRREIKPALGIAGRRVRGRESLPLVVGLDQAERLAIEADAGEQSLAGGRG